MLQVMATLDDEIRTMVHQFKEEIMSSDKPKVELVGIENSPEVRLQCESLLESLQNLAPSDSFMKAIFIKFGNTYEGVMCINSTAGRFSVSHQEASLAQLIALMQESMRMKLKIWKKGRFGAPATESSLMSPGDLLLPQLDHGSAFHSDVQTSGAL